MGEAMTVEQAIRTLAYSMQQIQVQIDQIRPGGSLSEALHAGMTAVLRESFQRERAQAVNLRAGEHTVHRDVSVAAGPKDPQAGDSHQLCQRIITTQLARLQSLQESYDEWYRQGIASAQTTPPGDCPYAVDSQACIWWSRGCQWMAANLFRQQLQRVLESIVAANRFDRNVFADDTEFADWAQSRCRHVLAIAPETPQTGRAGEDPPACSSRACG